MAAPVLSPLGERLRERTAPLAPNDADYGYAHAHLCEGMMLPMQQVALLVDPPDPYQPWETLFDPDLCPAFALPWLGQVVGVRVSRQMSEADQRAMIKGLGGSKVGSPPRIRAAVELTVEPDADGLKHIYFRERDGGDAYALEVVTDANHTPDPAATERAVIAQLPAGIILRVRTVVGWDYQAMTARGGTYAEQTADFTTYANLALNQPG
jgi:hypothetical protein